jgi:hypothetical protein
MVSLRNPNLIVVFDPKTGKVLWHQTGPWLRQHDPDFRDDGLISVFDNRGGPDLGDVFGGSRILLVDPVTHETREAYPPKEENRFFSPEQGTQQYLPNGNILIDEAEGGRVLEVTREGRVVWSYLNRYDETRVATLQAAIRYPENYFDAGAGACAKVASLHESQ